ncbi:hypothetical protein, partial [Klebsiella pneumoniae]|uniref:hypothetical protein n=1 Tax=Klebsiella pneumoniae TaxID=573 RepID=UPI00371C6B8A
MRLAFWRRREIGAAPIEAATASGPGLSQLGFTPGRELPAAAEPDGLDLRVIGQALMRRKFWILGPTLLAAGLSIVA